MNAQTSVVKCLFAQMRTGIRRFPLSALFALSTFISAAVFILTRSYIEPATEAIVYRTNHLWQQATLASIFAFFASVTTSLVIIRFSFGKKMIKVLYTFSTLLWIPVFFLTENFSERPASFAFYAYWGLICTFIFTSLYLCVTDSNEKSVFLHILKSAVFAELIALIVFAGLTASLLAANTLIFPIKDLDEYAFIVFIFSQALVAANIFLSQLSLTETTIPQSLKIIILYAAFPVYLLFIAVLYVYLCKILFTLNMPDGQINIFVSLATAFYLFFYFSLKQYPCRTTVVFYKIGHFILLPCIAAQLIAVWIRFDAYGLTSARWTGILYIVSVLYFIATVLLKKSAVRTWFLFSAALCFISTLTPFSVKNIPGFEQKMRLEKLLHAYGYYANGSFMCPEESVIAQIPQEKRRAIAGSYNALLPKDAKVYTETSVGTSFKDIFGFSEELSDEARIHRKYRYTAVRQTVDISGFTQLEILNISSHEQTPLYRAADGTKYDLSQFMLNMPENTEVFTIPAGKTLLYITDAYCEYDDRNGIFSYCYCAGYILHR